MTFLGTFERVNYLKSALRRDRVCLDEFIKFQSWIGCNPFDFVPNDPKNQRVPATAVARQQRGDDENSQKHCSQLAREENETGAVPKVR